jgi:hypothetical protein
MRMNKHEFLAGTSILGMVSLVGAVSSGTAEQIDGKSTSVFNVFTNHVGSILAS